MVVLFFRKYLRKVQKYINSDNSFFVLVTELRGYYDIFLSHSATRKLKIISIEGTLEASLKEVRRKFIRVKGERVWKYEGG